MNEVIRIEVLALDGGKLEFRNVVTGARGRAAIGDSHLEVGMEAVVDLADPRGRARVERVLEPAPPLPTGDLVPVGSDDAPALSVDGVAIEVHRPDVPLAVGQVRLATIAFSSHRTADRDRGRTAKTRPCVVIEIDGDHARGCPIHGSGTAVRRSWSGRRLHGWRELGVRKPSQVSAAATWVRSDTLGPLIGELDHDDRRRLGL